MQTSQRNVTLGLALMAALLVVLVGRTLRGPADASPPDAQLRESELAFIDQSGDSTYLHYMPTVRNGLHQVTSPAFMRPESGNLIPPMMQLAENGAYIATADLFTITPSGGYKRLSISSLSGRSLIVWDGNGDDWQYMPAGCLFPDISPDGQTVVCVKASQLVIATAATREFRQLGHRTGLGAPTLYNTLVTVKSDSDDRTIAISLLSGELAPLQDARGDGLYTNDGTCLLRLINADDGQAAMIQRIAPLQDGNATFNLPEAMRGDTVELVAVSDDGNMVLLYMEQQEKGVTVGHMGLLHLDTGASVVFVPAALSTSLQGDFSADGKQVTYSLNNIVYYVNIDGSAMRLVESGLQPVLLDDFSQPNASAGTIHDQ